jgi:mRNA interferase MazF
MRRGEVRLYRFAAPDKTRPVVVLTRDATIPRMATVTVAAVTRTRRGVPSEVTLSTEDGMKYDCAVNLHNLATVQQQKVGALVCSLSDARMEEICRALANALGCALEH